MARFLLLPVLAFSAFAGAQEACKPNYQINRSNCIQTSTVERLDTHKLNHQLVNSGACNAPEGGWAVLCNEKLPSIAGAYPGSKPSDVVASNPQTSGIAGMCGSVTNLKQKVDVFCDFEVKQPIYKMESAASCPANDVVETAGCFQGETITVSSEALNTCLSANPKSVDELWTKAGCLTDLYRATQSFTTKGLSTENVSEINRQLDLIISQTNKPNVGDLHNYLVVRKRDAAK